MFNIHFRVCKQHMPPPPRYTSSFSSVGVVWFAIAWVNAPMWPAEAVVMKENFKPESIDGNFRLLSISSRLGIFSGMGLFSALLTVMDWRSVCAFTATIGAVTVVAVSPLIPSRRGGWATPHSTTAAVGGQRHDDGESGGGDGGTEDNGVVGAGASGRDHGLYAAGIRHGVSGVGGFGSKSGIGTGGFKSMWRRAMSSELLTVMRKPWYMWAALAMCGLMAVLGLISLVSTFFSDTVKGASHSRVTLLSSSFPAGILTCMVKYVVEICQIKCAQGYNLEFLYIFIFVCVESTKYKAV
jgi:hypothetical protein